MSKINKKALNETIHAEKSQVPIANMAFKDIPPPFISIIGPESSGKTTLLKSLIKHFWKKKAATSGPITMKISHKRFTFYESTNNIENIIDTIKVSDMVIIIINLSVGLQKETLETINMINSQGVPKLGFVFTHYLDKSSEKAYKSICKRIQKEFSYPMKFFQLGMNESDRTYDKIWALARYVETMKYRPVEWKCTHPHIVVDSVRNGYAYGYLRGGPLNYVFNAHIPGYGDETVSEVAVLEDPCDLHSRVNILYNPAHSARFEVSNDSASADLLDFEDENVQMFCEEDKVKFDMEKRDEKILVKTTAHETLNNECDSENKNTIDNAGSNCEELREEFSCSSCDSSEFQLLKSKVNVHFRKNAETEEELEIKFNENYKEKNDGSLNFLQREKQKHIKSKEKLEETTKMIIPGTYIRMKLSYEIESLDASILVIGSYLPSENTRIFLKAKIMKNKWQKLDLKSNSPFFFSMGWFRFQSIPIFSEKDRMLKYCKQSSEMLFYGPSVPAGTSFFLFDHDLHYRILGNGIILDASGSNKIKKKLKLIGYPKKISGNNVIVQSMFSSDLEVNRFINARLCTVSGLRGLIKSSIGTDGCFRSTFEGTLLMSDIIFLKCYVPVEPCKYLKDLRAGSEYVRSLKLIKKEMGLPLFEASLSSEEDSFESVEEYVDRDRSKKRHLQEMELKKLEKDLPFHLRKVKEIHETVKMPIPPEKRKEVERHMQIALRMEQEKKEMDLVKNKRIEEKMKRKSEEEKIFEERKRRNAVQGFLEKRKHKKHRR